MIQKDAVGVVQGHHSSARSALSSYILRTGREHIDDSLPAQSGVGTGKTAFPTIPCLRADSDGDADPHNDDLAGPF